MQRGNYLVKIIPISILLDNGGGESDINVIIFPENYRLMPNFLNRYTTLPVLFDTLVKKRITLINPEKWEDRNDAYFIDTFRRKKKYKTVLGICFSRVRETYHHWKIYAPGIAGVCIEFNKAKIIRAIKGRKNIRGRAVKYEWIKDAQSIKDINMLPFIKRKPFKDEQEFRIVYWNKSQIETSYDITIDIDFINKITLSPFLPESLIDSVKNALWNMDGPEPGALPRGGNSWASKFIDTSTLLENNKWKEIADNI